MKRGPTRWLVVIVLLALAAIALGQAFRGGRRATGDRVRLYVPERSEVAAAAGALPDVVRQVPPPVNPEAAEAFARSLTMGKAPLPDDRHVVSYQRGDTGAETTIALLLYDDPSEAERADSLAEELLPRAIAVSPQPAELAGAEGARRWTGPGYAAFTFRCAGVVVFLGTTDPAGGEDLAVLAAGIVSRLSASPPASATPAKP